MRQVPKEKLPYLIIGNGRIARHFRHYFQLQSIPFHSWWRYCGFELDPLLRKSEKGLVLISDDAIESFIRNILSDNVATRPSLTFIHCSGVLSTPLAESAHPLMTFGPELYDLETYQSLAFVTEMGRKSFSDLFPELPNPSYVIQPGKNNFTMHGPLWLGILRLSCGQNILSGLNL